MDQQNSHPRKFPSALRLRHSIGGRILAGYLFMALISITPAVTGIYFTNQAGSKLTDLIDRDQLVTKDILRMELALEKQASSIRGYLLLPKNEEIGKKELSIAQTSYKLASEDLERDFPLNPVNQAAIGQIKSLYTQLNSLIEEVLAINLENFYSAPQALWEQKGQMVKNQLINIIDQSFAAYRTPVDDQIKNARFQSENITYISVMLVIVSTVLCGLVTLILTRSITQPLRNLAGVAQAIRAGDLTVKVPPVKGDDEVAYLSSAMEKMAENLRQSREELEASLANTERRNRELSAVNQVTRAISQSLNLEKVLKEALEEMMVVAEVEHGSLFLVEEEGEFLTLAVHHGQSKEFVEQVARVKRGEQLTGFVAAQGKVFITRNPGQNKRVTNPVLRKETYKQFYLGVPLKNKGRVVGVVNLTSPRIRAVSESEVDLFNAIGSQIGIAIENARLYRQAQQLAVLEERNRLARDLHDSVIQTIFSITLTAESARALLVKKPDRLPAQLERLQNLARSALSEMRALIFQLRPAALEEQGLVVALEKHLAVLRNKENFEIELQVSNTTETLLSAEHEQALYRIAQEALNNVIKHSQATHVWVKLATDSQKVVLIVKDNGMGFEPEKQSISKNIGQKSFGVTSMTERAELVGGVLDIESQPGQGSTVTATLPLMTAPRPVGLGIN